jgi:malonate-semialdehyde dehydrogenase (acetylating)/methylmalonate-semialdehyde dehydrogenase
MTDLPIIPHWIDGVAVTGASGRTGPVFDPALGVPTKAVALAGPADLRAAIASATAGFRGWSATPLGRRQAVLFRFRDLLAARSADLAAIITGEHGKVLSDAAGEVARGLEIVELATGFPHLLKGAHSENVSTGVDVYSIKQPLGVVAVISPFNFPAMVPMWFYPLAIAAGNAVILKPSEKDPSASIWIAKLWKEAGLPDGVFTVLQGDREAVDGLLEAPEIAAISFVGSTPVARHIYETATRNGKRVQALGGAKNHMLVLPDADLDLVADSAVNAGYGSAGERCMAISVVVVVEPVGDALVDRIRERIGRLRIGDGRRDVDMGPLVTGEHRDRVASYLDVAVADGARLVIDGRGVAADGDPAGFWLGPSLVDAVPPGSRVYVDEIFGPVLAIVRVDSYEEGVALINANPYGNGTAIFTNDGGAARRFQTEVTAGMVGINVPIPVPVGYYSFGGWKDSIFGASKAYGIQGLDFFTREKTVTARWLDPSHGGINLGFPRNG